MSEDQAGEASAAQHEEIVADSGEEAADVGAAATSKKRSAAKAFVDDEVAGEDPGQGAVKQRGRQIKWEGVLLDRVVSEFNKASMGKFPSTAVANMLNKDLKDFIEAQYGVGFVVSACQVSSLLPKWQAHVKSGGTVAGFHPFEARKERLRKCASVARGSQNEGTHTLNPLKYESSLWMKVNAVTRCTSTGSPIAAVASIFFPNGMVKHSGGGEISGQCALGISCMLPRLCKDVGDVHWVCERRGGETVRAPPLVVLEALMRWVLFVFF